MPWEGLKVPTLGGFEGFAPPDGQGLSKVMLVGEALGEWEAKESIPFNPKAPAGSLLNRLIHRAGFSRDSFVITNVVWSRPPNNRLEGAPYEAEAVEAFRPFLDRAIEIYKPAVIIALGNSALKRLTQYGRRERETITSVQGYVLGDGPYIIPQLHPASLLPRRGENQGAPEMYGVIIWAIQLANHISRNGWKRTKHHYATIPTIEQAEAFFKDYNPERHILSYDIETPDSGDKDEEEVEEKDISYDIKRISFCYCSGEAISFPWQKPFIHLASKLLGDIGPKRVWNGDFDNPRLAAAGSPVAGRVRDSMWAWHYLQPPLPRSLGFVAPFAGWDVGPWKHLSGDEPELYSAMDADALQWIGDWVDGQLKSAGRWDTYERHCVDTLEVLTQCSKNGLPLDQAELARFKAELQAKWDERFAELQRLVPDELKPCSPPSGYKNLPADTSVLIKRTFLIPKEELSKAERATLTELDEALSAHVRVERWCRLLPFLPTSSKQVLDLLKHYGVKPGVSRKTKAASADDDTLKRIIRRAPRNQRQQELVHILTLSRECRQLKKVLGTYVEGWKPGTDGRVHSTPGFWGAMLRLSWRRPNISGTIQDKQEEYIAKGFRRCVRAGEGKFLCEADWKGIEAKLVGWFANDTEYMRLSSLGVHDYFCYHLLVDRHKLSSMEIPSLSLPDAELCERFRWVKQHFPKDRDDAKHCVHGQNYGMGPSLMSNLYNLPLGEAQRLQQLYFELFPKVKAWQQDVQRRADRDGRLVTPFGDVMPFYEVKRWNSRKGEAGAWEMGDQAKSALSFLPRDTAAAMLKEVLLRPSIKELAQRGYLLATTHDALLCECPENLIMPVAELLREEMESPVKELGNLVIECEVKYGRNWSEEMQVLTKEVMNVQA